MQASYMGHMLVATELFHSRRTANPLCTPEALNEHRNTTICRAQCSLKTEDYMNIVYTSLGEFVGARSLDVTLPPLLTSPHFTSRLETCIPYRFISLDEHLHSSRPALYITVE